MRITERQLRRIIRESVASMLNEGVERQIVGPDYGGGKQSLSVGAKILALVGEFRKSWRTSEMRFSREKASEEQQDEIKAFRKYATVEGDDGPRIEWRYPPLEAALDAFIKTWASDPVWRPTRAVDAADDAYEAHAPVNAADDNSNARDEAESAPHAAGHREMTGEKAHKFGEAERRGEERRQALDAAIAADDARRAAASSGTAVSESKRRLPSRKLW